MSRPICSDCGKVINYYAKRCQLCDYKLRGKRQVGKNNPNWIGGIPKCLGCGKEVMYTKKYCRKCAGLIRRGDNKIVKECRQCGKAFRTYSKKRYLCSHECQGLYKVGKNACNWQGGISFEEYPKDFTDGLKERIRFRDGYKCRECGCPQVECARALDVHHIDYDKHNNMPDNLISLCQRCHTTANVRRPVWKAHFKEVVNGLG